jgi:hypothetical protein
MSPTTALRQETLAFLRELELASNRKLNYPEVTGRFVEISRTGGRDEVFDEVIFLAKFITKSAGVMRRIGVDGEGYDKLSAEFKSSLEKGASLLEALNRELPDEVKKEHETRFSAMTHESLEQLVSLMQDLALVKNWVLDGKRLP